MHVRYLQHQHQDTVQLLLMPLNAAANAVKSTKWSDKMFAADDDANELESVPLPIQTFLWRQTNPFIGAKIGKLHEASCVTFERVVVQNILHGLSPSLSDAIGSVSRWRFVRAAFPHIVQCCATLLSETSSPDAPLSGPTIKILYILHWLLLDSANECCDSESRKSITEGTEWSAHSVRQYTFSISSIQLFVYLIAPLINNITEEKIIANIRLESGCKIWQSLWQHRQPEVLCFSAPVKQRRSHFALFSLTKKAQPASVVQGIYLGDENEAPLRRPSQAPPHIIGNAAFPVPPPKPPRTDLAVLASMKKKKAKEQKKQAQKHDSAKQLQSTDVLKLETIEKSSTTEKDEKIKGRVVRSVSEYHDDQLAINIKQNIVKSKTTNFDISPTVTRGMEEIDEALKLVENNSLSDMMIDLSDKAPLVELQEICSCLSGDMESFTQNGCEIVCETCKASVYRNGSLIGTCRCKTVSSSSNGKFKIVPLRPINFPEPIQNEIVQNGESNKSFTFENKLIDSTQTVVRRPTITVVSEEQHEYDPLENLSVQSEQVQQFNDPQEASYLDVAVIRCLLIKHWSEEGIYWATKYFINRLFDIKKHRDQEGMFRSRANSAPTLPNLKLFGSRTESRHNISEIKHRAPTWDDLQLDHITARKIISTDMGRSRRSPDENNENKRCKSVAEPPSLTLKPDDLQRRSSMTLPISSIRDKRIRLDRNRSDPSISNSSEILSTKDTRSGSVTGVHGQLPDESTKQFFPEALGSSAFIEKNGYLSFTVVLKAVNLVIQRCSSIRISESSLNICESLLEMPDVDFGNFFSDIIQIVLRIYIWLGCPNGCNEGVRTAQGDFLRVKARTLFATIHRMDPEEFSRILVDNIQLSNVQLIIDVMHSITGFCRPDLAGRPRNDSLIRKGEGCDWRVPSYRNHFNESLKGIEGTIVNAVLKHVISKLMRTLSELLQPENMSLYQDVRLFVSFVQEQHGNPFRKVGLSALLDGRYVHPKTTLRSESNDIVESKSENSDEGSARSSISGLTPAPHYREQISLRRGIFKKKEKSVNADESDVDSSPCSTPRNAQSHSYEEGIGFFPLASSSISPLIPVQSKKKSGGRLHFAFNLLKSVRSENNDDEYSDVEANEDGASLEGCSAEGERRSKIAFRNTPKLQLSRQRTTAETDEQQMAIFNLPMKKLINLLGIQEGVRRFSFFLETCRPGSFPDPPLLAALLDLKSPVLGRAALILECAFFVHRCNKGDWPEWIRSSTLRQLSIMGCGSALGNRGTPSATRRMHMMQRAAGRCFYQWGVQIAERMHKLMEKEGFHSGSQPKQRLNKRELKQLDDLEDFFDEGVVNDESGEACPPALFFLACVLLNEITSFLRETFQGIPRQKSTKTLNSSGWEKLMSHRRWSILSNTFNPQQQQTSGSIQSIADTNLALHQGDRRISLSTNEEDSSRGSHDTIEEQHLHAEKKARRLAQGRQRLLKKGSPMVQLPQDLNQRKRPSIRARKQSRSIDPGSPSTEADRTNSADMMVPEIASRDSSKTTTKSTYYDDSIPQTLPPTEQVHFDKYQPSTSGHSSNQGSMSRQNVPSSCQAPTINYDEEEEKMLKKLPWIKVVIVLSNSLNLRCNHEKYCNPKCFERIYRQCYRLTEALRKVYGDEFSTEGRVDKRKAIIDAWNNKLKQKRRSTNRQPSAVPRRESAAVRQGATFEKTSVALRNLLIEKLAEIETNKEPRNKNQDNDDLIEARQLQSRPRSDPMLLYLETQILNIAHSPLSVLLKGCLTFNGEEFKEILGISWHLLTHANAHIVASAASLFIVGSVRRPEDTLSIMRRDLYHSDTNTRAAAIRRFYALWRNRFHVWLKLEEGAQMVLKIPPPSIDFTLPSPPIGQSQSSVVDPPWMPHIKTKVEELTLKEEEQATSQTIMTMTRTRRKQKQEMVRRAVHEAEERQSTLRQRYLLRATPIIQQAAYEPALFHHQFNAQQATSDGSAEENEVHVSSSTRQQMPVAQPLFPSSILTVVPIIIEMIDDVQVDEYGISVSDVAKKIIWSCIVEDSSLFLRHFLEKLTNRDRQSSVFEFRPTKQWEQLISLLRKLVIRFSPLPSQTAHSLLNYLFGFVMYYVRSPCDGSDRAIAMALSLTWLIAPHVHGLYFKDLKQTLKKEQCDQALMITANVPSAKKIIVHGPDSGSGGIPSQFPIHEDTQFQQILTDSLEFFNIAQNEINYYYLVDVKTNLVHVPSFYVRDFYFFHRSFYPQLSLIRIEPDEAQLRMKKMAFIHKFSEIGKVLLTHNALTHSPENVIPQRIFFLHDEFTHLPSFPRKSLETCFGMHKGEMGYDLHVMDAMHKFVWAQLISDMFEKMENAFMFGDLHLFINVINGISLMHCEDIMILRRCMATYISMTIRFNTLFASQGFFLVMPTLLRCYSQRQTNGLLCRTIEYVCKQFYILHRKPFFLQMAGSVANILDNNDSDFEVNPMKVKAKYWFNLIKCMEDMNDLSDPLDILGLVNEPKPLKALDLCYRDDPNTFNILTDGLASCVTVCAFAPESRRSYQMLLVMRATIPYFVDSLVRDSISQNNNASAIKHELSVYVTLCVEMKALVNSCEILARGPTRTFDIVNSVSDRGKSLMPDSPQFFDPPTVFEDETKVHYASASTKEKKSTSGWENLDNSEMQREAFRRPRDAILVLSASYIDKLAPRLKELSKMISNSEHIKIPEIFDYKCHVKLSEIALALLKVAPYDMTTMSCKGLQTYFMSILPVTDWSVEGNRSTLNIILRRLDKTIQKIGKKMALRRRTNWTALTNWLIGLDQTLIAYPYIAHLHPLKTTTQMCLRIMIGDPCIDDSTSQSAAHSLTLPTILHASSPPASFCNAVLKIASFLMQTLGQASFSLEYICSTDGIGPTSDRLEAVLCHIIIPLFLLVTASKKDALQLHPKDIAFSLNMMQNAINPPFMKQNLAPTPSTNLATSIMRGSTAHTDVSGRQGSVSVTDRGHSATVSAHRIVRESVYQSIFLALKVMMVAFEKQMTMHWAKLFKIVRDLINKKVGGYAFHSFIEFIIDVNLPISLLILPLLQSKANQKMISEQDIAWQNEVREHLNRSSSESADLILGNGTLLTELSQELQSMKEDFMNRPFEIPRSYTPTIAAELHSETGSAHSGHRLSYSRTSESRRLSTTNLPKVGRTGPSSFRSQAETMAERTIIEDVEDEGAQMIPLKIIKSPSLPVSKRFEAWRSIRRASSSISETEPTISAQHSTQLHETPFNQRITKSCTEKSTILEEGLSLPLNIQKPLVAAEISAPLEPIDRHRVVSFITPKYTRKNSSDDEDFVDRITACHHYV